MKNSRTFNQSKTFPFSQRLLRERLHFSRMIILLSMGSMKFFSRHIRRITALRVHCWGLQMISWGKVKGKVCIRAKWPIRPELIPVSVAWNRVRVCRLPPGWDASPSQGYPPALSSLLPIYYLVGERHCESKVYCSRTQHNVPGLGSNPDRSLRSREH